MKVLPDAEHFSKTISSVFITFEILALSITKQNVNECVKRERGGKESERELRTSENN